VEVEKIIGRGSGFVAVEIPFTPRAKRVLELSLEEARQLGAWPCLSVCGDRTLVVYVTAVVTAGCELCFRPRLADHKRLSSKNSIYCLPRLCLCLHRRALPRIRIGLTLAATVEVYWSVTTGHNYIGTEHILLGLLREGEGVAARVLETLGATNDKIKTQVRPTLTVPSSGG